MAYEAVKKKLSAHIGKFDGLFARLSLLWHCIEGTEGLIVSESMSRGVSPISWGVSCLPHAAAFYAGMLALSDTHDRLTKVAGYILAKKLPRITNRDVQRGDRSMRGLDRQEIESVFNQLEALGWLMPTTKSRWAAPLHWQVNPEVHRRFAERGEREAARRARERATLLDMFNTTGGNDKWTGTNAAAPRECKSQNDFFDNYPAPAASVAGRAVRTGPALPNHRYAR